jgi:hypothetical protein
MSGMATGAGFRSKSLYSLHYEEREQPGVLPPAHRQVYKQRHVHMLSCSSRPPPPLPSPSLLPILTSKAKYIRAATSSTNTGS